MKPPCLATPVVVVLLGVCTALLACIHAVLLCFYDVCLGHARCIEAVVVCGGSYAGNTGHVVVVTLLHPRRVVVLLHRRAIVGWNDGFRTHRTHPTDPANSEPPPPFSFHSTAPSLENYSQTGILLCENNLDYFKQV